VGCISTGVGPIIPGAGVNKRLPAIGNVHIMGISERRGIYGHVILQNTRLSLVMKMADIISAGISYNLTKYPLKTLKGQTVKTEGCKFCSQ